MYVCLSHIVRHDTWYMVHGTGRDMCRCVCVAGTVGAYEYTSPWKDMKKLKLKDFDKLKKRMKNWRSWMPQFVAGD